MDLTVEKTTKDIEKRLLEAGFAKTETGEYVSQHLEDVIVTLENPVLGGVSENL